MVKLLLATSVVPSVDSFDKKISEIVCEEKKDQIILQNFLVYNNFTEICGNLDVYREKN